MSKLDNSQENASCPHSPLLGAASQRHYAGSSCHEMSS